MKIVVAPDKFKGCLTASAVASAISKGVFAFAPDAEVIPCPLADGGDGTVDVILRACGGRSITRRVTGPLPELKVDATFAMLSDGITAVIETAAASGLALLKLEDRNPLNTTTFGTGELIAAAVSEGAKKIVLGLGGSATVDAGIGCLQACGFTLLMEDGEPTAMTEPLCGRDLSNVLMVKHGRGEITAGIEIVGVADVTNPLLGPNGAAHVFGPQKGASPQIVEELAAALLKLSQQASSLQFSRQNGSGAAGGLGFSVCAFMGGALANGFDWVSNLVDLPLKLQDADLCITGEGQLDSQSAAGKVVGGVASLCDLVDIPCICIAGSIARCIEQSGLTARFCICDGPMSLKYSIARAEELIIRTASNCVALFHAGYSRKLKEQHLR